MAKYSQFFKCMFALYFSLRALNCQQDCTDLDCPPLENCIEETLETGACCASCLQKGCSCEGYQYYDCLNAGFKFGKVPEGDSYFVDYGSTECSCPAGGGRISCHFISCPEMPPNCIEVSEPVDGCMQCERVGCIHNGQKFEAGHSFHINSCQVCHCPNDGGKPMCYPVPECDPKVVHKPVVAGPPLDESKVHFNNFPYMFDQEFPNDPTTPEGNLPLFKAPARDNEDLEDYDYGPTHFPDTYLHSLAFATESSSFNRVHNLVRQNEEQNNKLELKENYGVHNYPTESPPYMEESTVLMQNYEDVTSPWKLSKKPTIVDLADFKYPLNTQKHFGSFVLPLKTDLDLDKQQPGLDNSVHLHESSEAKDPFIDSLGNPANISEDERHQLLNGQNPLQYTLKSTTQSTGETPTSAPEGLFEEEYYDVGEDIVPLQNSTEYKDYNVLYEVKPVKHVESDSRTVTPTYKEVTSQSTTADQTSTPAHIATTTKTLFNLKQDQLKNNQKANDRTVFVEEEQDYSRKATAKETTGQFGLHSKDEGGADDDLVKSCCVVGQKWAAENDHCVNMPFLNNDKTSICSIAQKQCCLSSVREAHCESGLTAARGGSPCGVDQEAPCPDDTYQVCCSCCALGLRVRQEGLSCDRHLSLGYPCGHIFLTCCEEEAAPSHTLLWSKHRPRATAPPRQVLVSPVPRQALSISASEDTANTRLDQEDVDHCQAYAGQLCQHTCSNTWGSYLCGCHRGYSLQPDGHSCLPESPDEDNRLTEDDDHLETSTSKTTTTINPLYFSPCEEKQCSQQCSVIGGRALCSCLPGFSLMTDGRTCRDVDECLSRSHSCRAGQRCRNTDGSFVCERILTCAPGYVLNNGQCEDIDECVKKTHNCGGSFVCDNTPGSFRCRPRVKCITGFTQDSHGNCIDINECSALLDPCGPSSRCINTVGSYNCQKKSVTCSHGYHANAQGEACVDVDECQVGSHRCGSGQICHNLPGSYRCECQTGYQYDALRKVCNDINECWRFPGRLCSQTCENTPGSYLCSCTSGFILGPDGKKCEDINECEKNPCSQECANVFGSYQCYCRQGYFLKEDGHTCEDIDECSQNMGNLCTFQCINVIGSYHCACPADGYIMAANGRTCKDVDECSTGSHNCSFGQSCFNLQGGFRCLSFDCPQNYNKVSDTRCERLSCPLNSLECMNSPVRITYYQLSFQTNIIVPAQIFRIGPSPAYSGDHIVTRITKGNDEGYFSTRKLSSHTGAVFLNRPVREPRDFLIDVEMRLLRQGTVTSFVARIYVFITSSHM